MTVAQLCYVILTISFILFLTQSSNCQRDLGVFVHITDIHYDPQYKEGTRLAMPYSPFIGCRKPADPWIPKNQTAGKFGTLNGNCDIPLSTLDSAVQFLSKFSPKPDFILFVISEFFQFFLFFFL